MPIRRIYQCPECFHRIEVELSAEQWDDPPPDCPRCVSYDLQEPMQQEFKPIALGGSNHAKAHAIAEDIIAKDYGVADYNRDRHEGAKPKVRYKDQTAPIEPSSWKTITGGPSLEAAAAIGRQTRIEFGSGLDVLQSNLKSGAQPDLIEVSKRRSAKIW